VAEQEFTGWFRRLNRMAAGAANLVSSRDSRVRRALSPLYLGLLYALSGGRGVEAEINGATFRVDPRFRTRLPREYEPELAAFLRTRVVPGSCCFDVGANVGIYVLQMTRWSAPGGRVVAFEPNPKTFEVLARHVRMNGLEARVTLVPLAAGREPGEARLFDDQAGSGLSRLDAANPATGGAVRASNVRVTTIDEYCTRFAVTPDVLLIDVEGFEFDVLAGAQGTIRRARPHVIVELHPRLFPHGAATQAAGARLLADLGLRPVPIRGTARGGQPADAWAEGAVTLEAA
jgi:FkbM family methyltransferase